jgi:hypothetical protein
LTSVVDMPELAEVRWGIIGVGDVCEVKAGPAFQKAEGSKLVAVMRRNADKAKDFAVRHGVPRCARLMRVRLMGVRLMAVGGWCWSAGDGWLVLAGWFRLAGLAWSVLGDWCLVLEVLVAFDEW